MSAKETLIKVENLQKYYKGGAIKALDGINTEIKKGEVVVVIGPSGSGKSTFIRCLNLLETPTEGQIFFEGSCITDKGYAVHKHREKVGMVFQQFNLFANMTIKANIMLAPVKLGVMTKDEASKKADELLTRIGLLDKADAYPAQLSGGEQQRVSIARALAKNPKLLLCDEPTGALDYNTSKEILKLIEDVNKKYGNTIIMVTHNEAIKNMADHVIKLRDGAVRHNDINTNKVSAEELEW